MRPGLRRKLSWAILILAPLLVAVGYLYPIANDPFIYDHHPEEKIPAPRRTPDHLRVLFIGNSFTFGNGGLPLILQQLVDSARLRDPSLQPIIAEKVTRSGASLEDLWKEGLAQRRIQEGNWDVVILQDFSRQPLKKKSQMMEYINRFDAEAHKVGARTMLFMTWALHKQPEDQQAITDAYIEAGKRIGAQVVPAGRVWQELLRENPSLPLYSKDEKHPSQAGSYLNACLFFSALYGKSPLGLTEVVVDRKTTYISLKATDAQFLQARAALAMGVVSPVTQPATTQSAASLPTTRPEKMDLQ